MTPADILANAIAALEKTQRLIISAAIASCECHTKTPEAAFHDPMCRYSKLEFALEEVESTLASLRSLASAPADTFQSRVKPWMDACFGPVISADKIERNHRFIEEALELVQANGCTKVEAHQLVDYVYDRDKGDINQEVGGVMVTLAALCLANGLDMHSAGETELARVWTKIDKIRAKQAAKPKHSPLPAAPADHSDAGRDGKRDEIIEDCAKHLEKSGDGSANNIQTAAFYHAARLVRALKSAAPAEAVERKEG